jgi:hypothetical protein
MEKPSILWTVPEIMGHEQYELIREHYLSKEHQDNILNLLIQL